MQVRELVRRNILELKAYRSARDEVQEGVLLDANESPFPVDWRGIQLNRYPDPNQTRLREALAAYTGARPEQVVAGCGSDEVLDWIFKIFCQPGEDQVAVVEPTYGMYRVMAQTFGVSLVESRLDRAQRLDADAFLKEVPASVKVAFLCSPNNPTGDLLGTGQILKLCREWKGIVVLDEAYVEFSETPSLVEQVEVYPNLVVMRTLSKAFGRAALRLGYAVASPLVTSFFLKVKAPYNLSSLVMQKGLEALDGWERHRDTWRGIRRERERLARELAAIPGLGRIFPSQSNFLLFDCPGAGSICRKLREAGIVVRDRSDLPGLSECIRVSVGTREENDLFLRELRRILP
ncbi:MAG: histidinol-phosphate transaminase [Acidobacteriota bacterium]|nr:histidinol-phosphate transaminase [Acidobacteriota bacterium]